MNFPYKIIDLTHTLDENIPAWDEGCGFCQEMIYDYSDYSDPMTQVSFRVQQIKMKAGIGTHMDSPSHCIAGGNSIDNIPVEDLILPCIVIDISHRAHEKYIVSIDDVKVFETQYGHVPDGCFVMIRTGWEKYWTTPEQYRNNYVFPCVSKEVAQYFLQKNVRGIGIDTLSPDRPEEGFSVHKLFLGAGKYIIENAANLAQLPPLGSFILALPLKIKGATEAPMRLIALVL